MNRNTARKNQQRNPFSGFTLIETLVTLIMVLTGVIFISKIMIFGIDSHTKSCLRLKLHQKIQFYSQRLMSCPYDSTDLIIGEKHKQEAPFEIRWNVAEISPTLKRISFSVHSGQLITRTYFYKSKYIKMITAAAESPEEI